MKYTTTLLLLIAAVWPVQAVSPLELMRMAPGSQNAFAYVNIEGILKTARAKREGWDKKEKAEYLAGAVPFHPAAEEVFATTDFRGKNLSGNGSALLIPLKKDVDLNRVAAAVGGEKLQMGDIPAVKTQNNLYVIEIKPRMLGAMNTDHRQELSRWMRNLQEKTPVKHSRYLQNRANDLGNDHVTIAVDLEDMFDNNDVAFALALNEGLAKDAKSMQSMVRYLSNVKGIRILINFTETNINMTVVLDGSVNPQVPPELVKSTIVELIERVGAGFQNLIGGQPKVDGSKFYLSMTITDDELSHIMAIFLPPMPSLPAEDTIPIAPGKVSREVTLKYMDAVNKIVDELRKQSTESPKDYNKSALWHMTAIRKIESISTIGVDPKAIAYARGTCQLIAGISDSLRGVTVEWQELNSKAYLYNFDRPLFRGWWNDGWIHTNLPEIYEQQRELIKRDRENRAKLWEKIRLQRVMVTKELNETLR